MSNYIYIFDCVQCGHFYGEQRLTKDGRLLCPVCHGQQRVDSPYVERMEVLYTVEPYDPSEIDD